MTKVDSQSWRQTGFGLLRIVFGVVWAIDAWFKWNPTFITSFSSYVGAVEGQPRLVQMWINLWINIIKVDPHVFAHTVAVGETLIAIGLLLGIFSNLTNVAGIALSLVIWSTAEGFGGPYQPGSVAIGSAIIYALVFVALYLANSGTYVGLDGLLSHRLGRLRVLASG